MTIYRGWRRANGRTDVVRHEGRRDSWLRRPPGRPTVAGKPWDWGPACESARELALAILYDWGMPVELAEVWADVFEVDILRYLPASHWTLTAQELADWLIDALWLQRFGLAGVNGRPF